MKIIIPIAFFISFNIYAQKCNYIEGTRNVIKCENNNLSCYGLGRISIKKANYNQYSIKCLEGNNKPNKMKCNRMKNTRNLIICSNNIVTCYGSGTITGGKGNFNNLAFNCLEKKK